MITGGETNYGAFIKRWGSPIKSVPRYPRSIRLAMLLIMTSRDLGAQRFFSLFVLWVLLFMCRLERFVSLLRYICSVASSSTLFLEVFTVDEFPYYPELWYKWEYITNHSSEYSQRSSLLTNESVRLVENGELQVQRNKILLNWIKNEEIKQFRRIGEWSPLFYRLLTLVTMQNNYLDTVYSTLWIVLEYSMKVLSSCTSCNGMF